MVANSGKPQHRKRKKPGSGLPLVATGQGDYVNTWPDAAAQGGAALLEVAAEIARGHLPDCTAGCYPPAAWKRVKTLIEAVRIIDNATAAFVAAIDATTVDLVAATPLRVDACVTRVLADALAAAMIGEVGK